MFLDIGLFICLSLLIFSCFTFQNQKDSFRNAFKVASIMNMTVSDIYSSKQDSVKFGEYSKLWFTEKIYRDCGWLLHRDPAFIYQNLPLCLKPYCQKKTDFAAYVATSLL